MSRSGVEVVLSRGCSRFALPGMQSSSVSAASSSFSRGGGSTAAAARRALPDGPFAGLVICVTGLSKEARNQVKEATERMGGEYSGSLHPKCTHLVHSFAGRKFEHAVKHGPKNGLFVITFGWFVDCVRRNMRLDESLYSIKNMRENGMPLGEFNRLVGTPVSESSCLPPMVFQEKAFSDTTEKHRLQTSRKEHDHDEFVFTNDSIYIDPGISGEMRKKVSDAAIREGAKLLDHWFIGCHATYVVCEDTSVKRYVGHSDNIVTPLWILKTAKEKGLQRLVHFSSDLARQVAAILENVQTFQEDRKNGGVPSMNSDSGRVPSTQGEIDETCQDRQKFVEAAKKNVRDRRARRMQSCEGPIHPITPVKLMESICWTISEPTTSACIYTESSWSDDTFEQQSTTFFDANGDSKDPDQSTDNFSRPLRESEKSEVIFKNHFLTILFPIDRFGELGPSSRTFFSNGGFTRIQLLDHIYNFYQDNMSSDEINVALHTDSRHADRLRSLYASTESAERGFVTFKRIDFLGSRRSFEGLKRFSRENNSNVYELVIRA
uniref:BRCT domain-containing protein n=1 Tax=Leersia perrieri TaxID=77586 RepID=A0A0D9XE47_9ORYZ